MFLPRVLRPIPAASMPGVRRIGEVPFSVLTGPAGTHVAERLAGTIAGWDRWHGCVWLRAVSSRPDALAQELAEACRHRWDTPDADGRDAAGHLGDVLRRSPAEAVLVLEVDTRAMRGVRRLVAELHPGLVDRRTSLVAVTEGTLGSWWRPTGSGTGSIDDRWAASGPLPELCRDRLWHLAGRRPAVLDDVLAAAQAWGVEAVSAAVGAVWTLRALLDDLTGELLDRCDAGELAALRTCATTGYWHPRLTTPPASATRLRPWVVPLEEGWCWLRPIWKGPLRRQLSGRDRRRGAPVAYGRRHAAARPRALPAPQHGLLQARLFGELDVRVDGRLVSRWYGKRGRSVLRYLLARPQRACGRDELLATFWPDVPPEIARNRLQVAVSGLRKAFGGITGVNVVEYAEGRYRIGRALRVEVDVDRFESAVAAAKQADRAGDPAATVAAYRDAVAYYRGDFAADAPAEFWTLVPRESLRIAYVDALDRIGRFELADGAHDDCVVTGRRILEVDPCREDVHRMLMRCYLRQGRTYQAHRQYEFCRRVLRSVLDVEPAPETTRLHDAIRAGSAVEPALIGRRAPGR